MDGIAWASSAMVAAWTRLEIATDNLANVSTDGFRRRLAHGSLTPRGAVVTGVASQARGALRHTGRPFDLAIVGDGAFRVRDARGAIVVTRSGAFVRDRDGHLRDDAGRVLLDEAGRPVRASARRQPSAEQLGLPRGSALQCGALETSSVDGIAEMIDVLTAQRTFEGAEKIVVAIDQTRQKAADAGKLQ